MLPQNSKSLVTASKKYSNEEKQTKSSSTQEKAASASSKPRFSQQKKEPSDLSSKPKDVQVSQSNRPVPNSAPSEKKLNNSAETTMSQAHGSIIYLSYVKKLL